MSTDLSESARLTLAFVKRYTLAQGFPPNYREIMAATGIASQSTVSYALQQLADAKLIRHKKGQSRAIAITANGEVWLANR